ncbi:MAG: hypothetical protein M0015_09130 [Betaproteobacteria bacterium]|nr:hypothetical protein [Betaproteobacteria bacterium]
MAATVLSSARATEVGLYVARAFVRLLETLGAQKNPAATLTLQKKSEAPAHKHNSFSADTRLPVPQVVQIAKSPR